MAARTTPDASRAKLTSMDSSRAWPPAIRFSTRSSIHLIARPSVFAAITTAFSSRIENIFWPKLPPTSPMTTRMESSGMPSRREKPSRDSCTVCVDATTSRCWRHGSHEAMMPRGSIGTQR